MVAKGTTTAFLDALGEFGPLQRRSTESERKNAKLRKELEPIGKLVNQFTHKSQWRGLKITVYCAGSFGRRDAGRRSDIDLFIISSGTRPSRLFEYRLFSRLIEINDKLKYPDFSNDGEYLRIYPLKEMVDATGSRRDDHENLFTARMLLLLESVPVYNAVGYKKCLRGILERYFRDEPSHSEDFKPVFLINDVLRYWRTLCVNYEEIRVDATAEWRKRNSNLKFSRKLTVFGTVLALITMPTCHKRQVLRLCARSPLQRLAFGLDCLGDKRLLPHFRLFLRDYEAFLGWKDLRRDTMISRAKEASFKKEHEERVERFSQFLYRAMNHPDVRSDYREYLVL